MKAKIIKTFLAVTLFILSTANLYSQEKTASHIFEMTFVSIPYEQIGEFMDFFEKEFKPLDMQNEYVISTKVFRHVNGPSWNICMVTEYKDLEGWVAADKKYDELIQKMYPDKSKQEELYKKFGGYLKGHTDALVRDNPNLEKK